MTLYRALRNLDKAGRTIKAGSVFLGSEIGEPALSKLEQLGKIAPASTPPLAILPGWEARGRKLARKGIVTVEDFLSVPSAELAESLKVKADQIDVWKASLIECLSIPQREG